MMGDLISHVWSSEWCSPASSTKVKLLAFAIAEWQYAVKEIQEQTQSEVPWALEKQPLR